MTPFLEKAHDLPDAAKLFEIVIHEADPERLLDRQARDFESDGGFSERLYKARTGRERNSKR